MKNLILGICLLAGACTSIPEGVQQSIDMAGDNKRELKRVLRHYSRRTSDSLKFKAACFLIENMKWHISKKKITNIDPQLNVFHQTIDSTYYTLVKGKSIQEVLASEFSQSLGKIQRVIRDSVQKYPFTAPTIEDGIFPDVCTFDYPFLKEHIDNAFRIWKESPFARHLTFDEFCEYILPYRSITFYDYNQSGKQLYDFFGKYVYDSTGGNLCNHVQRYNLAVKRGKGFWGKSTIKEPLGLFDLFFVGKNDCVDIASNGCNILRACGIPTVVGFNSAYRELPNRHFHCSILDTNRKWLSFNPESSLPESSWSFSIDMNVYHFHFAAQKDAPFFLRAKNEYIPEFMNSPCIRDVTAHLKKVVSVTLPFSPTTTNRLAYLATFQRNEEGIIPVTWSEIDTLKQQVSFKNALCNMLYFPVYYDEKEISTFGNPFYLTCDSTTKKVNIHYLSTQQDKKGTLVLTRKFPRKLTMIRLAEKLVGSTFSGANRKDFADAQTLYTITQTPIPYLQDYKLKNNRPYRFYRFSAPKSYPHANVSMLEFITEKSYGYKNSMPPTPLPVLLPQDSALYQQDQNRVKLLDAPWEKMKKKKPYDGNMQTAPGIYSSVTLQLKKPQVVTRIRFAPKNADNGIQPGDHFELMYWENGWQYAGEQTAKHQHLEFKNVPLGCLYWLKNIKRGREELPFIIENGKQLFLYHDFMNEKK